MDNRNSPDRDVTPGDLDIPTADIPTRSSDLLDHRRQRESVGAELVRIHIHLILSDEATDACDFGHTRNGAELQPHKPILKGAELTQIERMARLRRRRVIQIVFVDPTDASGIGPEFRSHPLGKLEGKHAQLF
jgi:hypothetical protein